MTEEQRHVTSSDHVMRAITDDDNFRVITASTTDTVRQILDKQKVTGAAARHLADLVTGTVLVRETMAPTYRVQGLLRGKNTTTSIVADTHPDGMTRGLVQGTDEDTPFELAAGCTLQMMRVMAGGRVHRSVVQAPKDDVASALMTYMQESEQVVAIVATGLLRDEAGDVEHAGGFVVQLLPGAARGPLMVMTERLEAMPSADQLVADLGPERLLEELLYGMPYAQLETRPVSYGCNCSHERVVMSLSTIPRAELTEMVEEDEVIELSCDYCLTTYRLGRTHLEGLLASS